MRLRIKIVSLCIAAAECLALAGPAAALPFPVAQPLTATAPAESPGITLVAQRERRDRPRVIRRWNEREHGRRCRYQAGGCNNFYGGYYYANPWWLLPPVVGGAFYDDPYYLNDDPYAYDDDYYYVPRAPRINRRHIAWCRNHYRSYNRRNNTWIASSGRVRQCISPFI